jgi:WD40 repeat protein
MGNGRPGLQIAVFDASSGKQTALFGDNPDGIWDICFSADSSRLASACEDNAARVWNVITGAAVATCRGHTSKVIKVEFSPDGSRLATASADGTVRQWNANTGLEVAPPYDRHANDVLALRYSPDGEWIASAGRDRTIRRWRAKDRHDIAILHGHTEAVRELMFSRDGHRLASLSSNATLTSAWDHTARLWDVDEQSSLPVLRGHTSYVYPVTYSPDGRWLASGSWDGTARLWDAATGEPCATLPHTTSPQPKAVWGLAFCSAGKGLMTGSAKEDRLRIWDVATAKVRHEIKLDPRELLGLVLNPEETRVAVTQLDPISYKSYFTEVDLASDKSLFPSEGWALAYSPDHRWLATLASDEREIVLLDAQTHAIAAHFVGHENAVFKAAFSPDSHLLATCSRDHTVRVWEVAGDGWQVTDQGKVERETASTRRNEQATSPLVSRHPSPCRVLTGHTDEVYAIAFHPDGTRLATGGRDGAVWLWDVARGEEVVRMPGHKGYVWSLAFSPDGTTLASGSGDNTVRLWDTLPLKNRFQARREAAALRPNAERLVEQLWRQKNLAEIAETLRSDHTLSESQRHVALRALLWRAQLPTMLPVQAAGVP